MSAEPRPVTLTLAGVRSLTILEAARANTLAGIRQKDVGRFMRLLERGDAPPEELELAFTLLYAYAYQLELRHQPGLTWAEAQTWRLELDLETRDDLADAEAAASVRAAILTGLPPYEAGALSQAQLEEYGEVAKEREREAKAASRRRRSA